MQFFQDLASLFSVQNRFYYYENEISIFGTSTQNKWFKLIIFFFKVVS